MSDKKDKKVSRKKSVKAEGTGATTPSPSVVVEAAKSRNAPPAKLHAALDALKCVIDDVMPRMVTRIKDVSSEIMSDLTKNGVEGLDKLGGDVEAVVAELLKNGKKRGRPKVGATANIKDQAADSRKDVEAAGQGIALDLMQALLIEGGKRGLGLRDVMPVVEGLWNAFRQHHDSLFLDVAAWIDVALPQMSGEYLREVERNEGAKKRKANRKEAFKVEFEPLPPLKWPEGFYKRLALLIDMVSIYNRAEHIFNFGFSLEIPTTSDSMSAAMCDEFIEALQSLKRGEGVTDLSGGEKALEFFNKYIRIREEATGELLTPGDARLWDSTKYQAWLSRFIDCLRDALPPREDAPQQQTQSEAGDLLGALLQMLRPDAPVSPGHQAPAPGPPNPIQNLFAGILKGRDGDSGESPADADVLGGFFNDMAATMAQDPKGIVAQIMGAPAAQKIMDGMSTGNLDGIFDMIKGSGLKSADGTIDDDGLADMAKSLFSKLGGVANFEGAADFGAVIQRASDTKRASAFVAGTEFDTPEIVAFMVELFGVASKYADAHDGERLPREDSQALFDKFVGDKAPPGVDLVSILRLIHKNIASGQRFCVGQLKDVMSDFLKDTPFIVGVFEAVFDRVFEAVRRDFVDETGPEDIRDCMGMREGYLGGIAKGIDAWTKGIGATLNLSPAFKSFVAGFVLAGEDLDAQTNFFSEAITKRAMKSALKGDGPFAALFGSIGLDPDKIDQMVDGATVHNDATTAASIESFFGKFLDSDDGGDFGKMLKWAMQPPPDPHHSEDELIAAGHRPQSIDIMLNNRIGRGDLFSEVRKFLTFGRGAFALLPNPVETWWNVIKHITYMIGEDRALTVEQVLEGVAESLLNLAPQGILTPGQLKFRGKEVFDAADTGAGLKMRQDLEAFAVDCQGIAESDPDKLKCPPFAVVWANAVVELANVERWRSRGGNPAAQRFKGVGGLMSQSDGGGLMGSVDVPQIVFGGLSQNDPEPSAGDVFVAPDALTSALMTYAPEVLMELIESDPGLRDDLIRLNASGDNVAMLGVMYKPEVAAAIGRVLARKGIPGFEQGPKLTLVPPPDSDH